MSTSTLAEVASARTCQHCHRPIIRPPQRGPKPKFCSAGCREAARKPIHTNKCVTCGATFQAKHRGRRYCSAVCHSTPKLRTFQCVWCSGEFNRPAKNYKYCGTACAHAHRRVLRKIPDAVCIGCGDTFTPKEGNRRTYCSRGCAFSTKTRGSRARAECAKAKREAPRTCKACGGTFKPTHHNQWHCGTRRCWRARKQKAYAKSHPPTIETVRCGRCDKEFECDTRFGSQGRQRFCSKRCSKQHHAHLRRAVERDAFVEDVSLGYLMERDRRRCQLCSKPVDPSKSAPHPLAPTIDHIVPLARGGKHERTNTQLAHFLCNSVKRDGDGSQLRLIG